MKKIVVFLMLAANAPTHAATYDDTARVLSVDEKTTKATQLVQVCDDAPSASSGGVGTVIGAVAGGVLGAQVGKGNGRTAAAATGAVVGALAGNHLAKGDSQRNCRPSTEVVTRVVGYDVTYEYAGRVFTQFMPTAPAGDTLRLRIDLTAVR